MTKQITLTIFGFVLSVFVFFSKGNAETINVSIPGFSQVHAFVIG